LILQALAEDPDNGAYLDSYGWVLFQKGFYDEALPQLLRSAELITDDYVVYYHLGEVYLKLNNKKSALEYYKKANSFEENPDFDKIAEIISSLSK
jgi:tetratricopeptide (TPR) repeat protein